MKKPALCCCFTWIVFVELDFSCISVYKENLGWPIYRLGEGMGISRNGEAPSNEGMSLYRLCKHLDKHLLS